MKKQRISLGDSIAEIRLVIEMMEGDANSVLDGKLIEDSALKLRIARIRHALSVLEQLKNGQQKARFVQLKLF